MNTPSKSSTLNSVGLGVLCLRIRSQTDWLYVSEIVRIEGDGNYSRIHTRKGNVYVLAVTLVKLEKRLPGQFWRVHKQHLVNPSYTEKAVHFLMRSNKLLLNTGEVVPVARRRKNSISKALQRINFIRNEANQNIPIQA